MKDDLISRNAACDKMTELYNEDLEAYCVPIPESFDAERAVKAINELPSAQPGPKKGEWIRMSDADGIFYACSECGEWNKETIEFCPNCGVEMRKREYPCYSPPDGSQLFTNADRIRSMTDEELAEWLARLAETGGKLMNKQTWDVGDLAGERKEKTEEHKEMTIREKVLEEAKKAVCQDRNDQYGKPENNFNIIANLWCEYLRGCGADIDFLEPHDVAAMMILLKLARVLSVPAIHKPSFDNFVDIAGYAACAAECIFGNENKE